MIQFRYERSPHNGLQRTFLVGEWPDATMITPELLGWQRIGGCDKVQFNGKTYDIFSGCVWLRDARGTKSSTIKEEPGNKVRFTVENGEALYAREGATPEGYIKLRKISASVTP